MATFEVPEMNRRQRRSMGVTKTLPASALKVTRFGDRVCIGITEPGYVRLTDIEAMQLSDAILRLAGEPDNYVPQS